MADRWITKFQKTALPLIQKKFKPERVFFFGSRVKGRPRKDSDLDVIIVAASFKEIPFLQRITLLLRTIPFDKHVDYFCYTPIEFETIQNESFIIMDALEYAQEIRPS